MVRLRRVWVWLVVFALILPGAAIADTGKDSAGKHIRKRFHRHQKVQKFRIQSVEKVDLSKVRDRRIIVKLRDSERLDPEKLDYIEVKAPAPLRKRNYEIVRIPESVQYDGALAEIRGNAAVEYAVPDYLQQIKSVPNDPKYDSQWFLDKIEMPRAWDMPNGSGDVVVAVIDTGVDLNHPDLQGIFVDGQDIINKDDSPEDSVGHGTHVAGIIAANTGNKIGVAGVAGENQHVKIMPIKVANGEAFPLTVAISGIYYAADHGADVINMSFGGDSYNFAMADAIWYAHEKGAVLIAAAGNEGSSIPSYPASYIPVISVAATDRNDDRVQQTLWASNWGDWIDVATPGTEIYSTDISGEEGLSENDYSYGGGTSYSAPIVSAVAALLKSRNPDWEPAKIEWAIEQGAELSSEWNKYKGYGRVNAFASLALQSSDLPDNDVADQRGGAVDLQVGKMKSETVGLPFDKDWYSLSLDTDAEVAVELSGVYETLDLGIGLYKPKRRFYDKAGKGAGESYIFAAEAGTHYFTVLDYYNHWSSKPYHIKIRSIPRVHGTDRFETAVAVSKRGWSKAETVILARGDKFPDALSGTPLAHRLKAPILLTEGDQLTDVTREEIKRLGANQVILLGGPGAIGANVKTELEKMELKVERVNGSNRFETALAIYHKLKDLGEKPKKAVVVYYKKFPDALSIASYAARNGYPIFLVETDKIPEKTKAVLDQFDQTILVGGSGVISQEVFDQLQAMGSSPKRYAGHEPNRNRYGTGKAVIEGLNLPTDKVIVATGEKFPDVLTSSVLAAKQGKSLLLVQHDQIPEATRNLISDRNVTNFVIIGGEGAVNESVAKELLQ